MRVGGGGVGWGGLCVRVGGGGVGWGMEWDREGNQK